MSVTRSLFSRSLAGHFYDRFRTWYRFKYVLPKVREVTLDGLRLDVSALSPKIRNRLQSGAYEAHERQMCLEYLKPEDSVLELGGAIGFLGLLCRKKLGVRRFVTVEANPKTLEILKRNYALNGLTPECRHLAVADHDGFVELEVGSDFWENSIVSRPSPRGKVTTEVPAAKLSTVLEMAGEGINVLMIDIEGAEQYIDFDEIPPTIEKMIVEFHPQVLGAERFYDLVAGIVSRGYRVAREQEGTFVFLRRALPDEKDPAARAGAFGARASSAGAGSGKALFHEPAPTADGR